jgi:phosphoserine aminotransferase
MRHEFRYFSRVLDFTQFDIIYARRKKIWDLLGTLVIVKEEILGKSGRDDSKIF